jgi:serine protease Do
MHQQQNLSSRLLPSRIQLQKSAFMKTAFTFAVLLGASALLISLTSCSWFEQEAEAKANLEFKKEPPVLKLADPLPRNLFVELGKAINPATVSITTTQNVNMLRSRFRDPIQDFFEEFYGGRSPRGQGQPQRRGGSPDGSDEKVQTGMGTGFIIREDGLIITNNHVVAQGDGIIVQIDPNSKETFDATIIGRDQRTDLALIKINAKKPLPAVALGSSKDVEVGEWVAAFGNPFGHTHTMTVGIVSALGRDIKEINRLPFIQTDASINPGNSGGPLVNSKGMVIGVNSAIDARGPGIGFAIPIDSVKTVIAQLERDGRVRRAFLGVAAQPVNDQMAESLGMDKPEGVAVVEVRKGSPAEKAGMKEYDIILEFGERKIMGPNDLPDAVAEVGIGDKRKIKIWRYDESGRKKKDITLEVTLSEAPDERSQKRAGNEAPKDSGSLKSAKELGLAVADFTETKAQELRVPPSPFQGPIVTDVQKNSAAAKAGIRPGDMIIDVNRQQTPRAKDVISNLKPGKNMVRIVRGDAVAIIPL